MLSMRQKSVNVSRLQLIECLKTNLELHKEQYKEAVTTYHERLKIELKEAYDKVNCGIINEKELFSIQIYFNPPTSHEKDYKEILEMMEMSVDENINLDAESFRAFIKNEWPWTPALLASINDNKTYIYSKLV